MDGIQPTAARSGSPARGAAAGHLSVAAPLVKSGSDYLRALRRRVWLVLIIALAAAVPGTIWTMRRPAIYRVAAQILIQPPEFDQVLGAIVAHDLTARDHE